MGSSRRHQACPQQVLYASVTDGAGCSRAECDLAVRAYRLSLATSRAACRTGSKDIEECDDGNGAEIMLPGKMISLCHHPYNGLHDCSMQVPDRGGQLVNSIPSLKPCWPAQLPGYDRTNWSDSWQIIQTLRQRYPLRDIQARGAPKSAYILGFACQVSAPMQA